VRIGLDNRWPALRLWIGNAVLARVAERSSPDAVRILGSWSDGSLASITLLTTLITASTLAIALSHANVTTNSDSAALVSDSLAQLGTLHESGKLLRTEYAEGLGLDFHSPVDTRREVSVAGFPVKILLFLSRLE
jgi:hypothetical protein